MKDNALRLHLTASLRFAPLLLIQIALLRFAIS